MCSGGGDGSGKQFDRWQQWGIIIIAKRSAESWGGPLIPRMWQKSVADDDHARRSNVHRDVIKIMMKAKSNLPDSFPS
ncbi:hypothetical protein GCM10023156_17990 [Novipirellula rosea]|uniref:Uncharacterized protein n=1 Tax=Novipirellula rosea TaxID=1031540 RepID=A0ABP8MHZ3_9BACT